MKKPQRPSTTPSVDARLLAAVLRDLAQSMETTGHILPADSDRVAVRLVVPVAYIEQLREAARLLEGLGR